MTENANQKRVVGPVMKTGEVGDAVLEAIHEDNVGRKIVVEEHASYMRIKVEGECVIKFSTVGDMLGRDVILADIEAQMPAFEGFIRTEEGQIRFV